MRRFSIFVLLPFAYACTSDQEFHKKEEVPEPFEDTSPEPDDPLPVAVCSVTPNPVTPPFEAATFDGTESYDPAGGDIVDYQWALVSKPNGSSVSLPDGTAKLKDFIPDLAGNYEVELVVVNDVGEHSAPCTVILESIPAEDLWIEMYWSVAHDDMDLHLLRPGGTKETATDCYYSNCVPPDHLDWGVHGSFDDDPSLDLDDLYGTGPENINITQPESGDFTVMVHDYKGENVFNGDNQVTVNIYLNGALEWTKTKTISGDGSYTAYAKVNWYNGTITDL